MEPEELFSKLPPELTRLISKKIPVSINNLDFSDIRNTGLIDDSIYDATDNYGSSLNYTNDYDGILTSNQEKTYNRLKEKYDYDLSNATGKDLDKLEIIENKIMEGVSNKIYEEIDNEFLQFKKKNKGKKALVEEIAKKFEEYLQKNYF